MNTHTPLCLRGLPFRNEQDIGCVTVFPVAGIRGDERKPMFCWPPSSYIALGGCSVLPCSSQCLMFAADIRSFALSRGQRRRAAISVFGYILRRSGTLQGACPILALPCPHPPPPPPPSNPLKSSTPFVLSYSLSLLYQGDWKVGKGWRSSQIGYFYGGATIQGLLPYYYTMVAPGTAKEVNR